jgi:crotonobetainyl-CoA:carnitine CoA-transferase CaiB-like acyl-CoA transferase
MESRSILVRTRLDQRSDHSDVVTSSSPVPLAGTLILDFTRILSGPYATMLLADLGADVVKIERPGLGDDTRSWGPPFSRGASTYFIAVNRGKRSLAVDLSHQRGLETVLDLARRADIVVENFRPGVTERLGIAYSDIRRLNAAIIYASINGFGSAGPRSATAGTEVIIEAETGLMDMMGTPNGSPVRFGVAMVDIATGIATVAGILAALVQQARDGRGRRLEFPLFSMAISALGTVIASSSADPSTQSGRWGSGHPSIVPYSAFEASDGYVVIGAINEGMWARLCGVLELGPLAEDPRAETNAMRVANRKLIEGHVGGAVKKRRVDEVTTLLKAVGVLVAPVRSAKAAVHDEQVAALGLIEELDGLLLARTPLAQFNPGALSSAPALGEHTSHILMEYLGASPEEIAALASCGAIELADDGPGNRPPPAGDRRRPVE